MEHREAARAVFGIASLVEMLGGNRYHVRAYRRAARDLMLLDTPAVQLVTNDGELCLAGLGPGLRRKLGELVLHGRMQFQDELWAEIPESVRELLEIPGVGPKTARLLAGELGIQTAAGIARAARRRQLRALPGIAARRERQLREAAESMLAKAA